jgi:hypothetical protein
MSYPPRRVRCIERSEAVLLSQYTFEVFADSDHTIDPDRLKAMMAEADRVQGGLTAPLEYVPPITGGDPRGWGLRIVITEEIPDEDPA